MSETDVAKPNLAPLLKDMVSQVNAYQQKGGGMPQLDSFTLTGATQEQAEALRKNLDANDLNDVALEFSEGNLKVTPKGNWDKLGTFCEEALSAPKPQVGAAAKEGDQDIQTALGDQIKSAQPDAQGNVSLTFTAQQFEALKNLAGKENANLFDGAEKSADGKSVNLTMKPSMWTQFKEWVKGLFGEKEQDLAGRETQAPASAAPVAREAIHSITGHGPEQAVQMLAHSLAEGGKTAHYNAVTAEELAGMQQQLKQSGLDPDKVLKVHGGDKVTIDLETIRGHEKARDELLAIHNEKGLNGLEVNGKKNYKDPMVQKASAPAQSNQATFNQPQAQAPAAQVQSRSASTFKAPKAEETALDTLATAFAEQRKKSKGVFLESDLGVKEMTVSNAEFEQIKGFCEKHGCLRAVVDGQGKGAVGYNPETGVLKVDFDAIDKTPSAQQALRETASKGQARSFLGNLGEMFLSTGFDQARGSVAEQVNAAFSGGPGKGERRDMELAELKAVVADLKSTGVTSNGRVADTGGFQNVNSAQKKSDALREH